MDDDTEQMWAAMERRSFLAMGAAAAFLGLTGCAGGKPKKSKSPATLIATSTNKVERRMKKHIKDKKRLAQARALLDKARTQVKTVSGLVDDSRDARGMLPPERQTREELLAVITEYDDKIRTNLLDACSLSIEMRKVITKSEWPLVFPQPKKKKGAA